MGGAEVLGLQNVVGNFLPGKQVLINTATNAATNTSVDRSLLI